MTEILDTIYSSFIIVLIIAMVLLFFFIGLSFKNPFKNKFLNSFYKVIMYICSVLFFISASFLNYGHARRFENISIGKTTICVFEKWIPARGKGVGRQARINIIDKETGARKERINAGKPGSFIDMRNDTICYLDEKDVVLYDAANLKEIYRIKDDEWVTVLPELIVGIENISITNQTINYPVRHYVQFDGLNGKKYWFDPFSKEIINKEPETIYFSEFGNRFSELTRKISLNKELKYLYTTSVGEGNLEAIIPAPNATKFFSKIDSTGYIAPFLLCIDTVKQVFVFGHYTTTKKEQYYVEAKDFNYNIRWKKANREIVDNSIDPEVNVFSYKNSVLYLGIGGCLLAVDPVTFKIYWTSHL